MVTAEFTILPIGTQSTSVGNYIAMIPAVLDNFPNIYYEISGMGTCLQGDFDEIIKAIREVQETLFATGLQRIYTVIKIDDRRDKDASLDSKKQRVLTRK